MKSIKTLILALLAITFVACQNEPYNKIQFFETAYQGENAAYTPIKKQTSDVGYATITVKGGDGTYNVISDNTAVLEIAGVSSENRKSVITYRGMKEGSAAIVASDNHGNTATLIVTVAATDKVLTVQTSWVNVELRCKDQSLKAQLESEIKAEAGQHIMPTGASYRMHFANFAQGDLKIYETASGNHFTEGAFRFSDNPQTQFTFIYPDTNGQVIECSFTHRSEPNALPAVDGESVFNLYQDLTQIYALKYKAAYTDVEIMNVECFMRLSGKF